DVTLDAGGILNLAGGSFGTGSADLNGGTIQTLGNSLTFSSHTQGTGTIQNGSATTPSTLTLNTTDSFNGSIADGSTATMSVTQTAGAFTLSGSNSYSGTTTIQTGATLKVGQGDALSGNSP